MKNNTLQKSEKKFETRDNKEYKAKSIVDSRIYSKEVESQM